MGNFDLNKTTTMLTALERVNKPTTTLVDTFFSDFNTYVTETVEVETRQGAQQIAPFVVPGSKGVNLARAASRITTYKAPLMKPARVTSVSDIERRGFGENVYSTKDPAQRAMELRSKDLVELIDSCTRRQELMAAQLLLNGEYECKGFADDGKTVQVDKISFLPDFKNKVKESSKTWDNPDAKILDSIGDLSRNIRRATGTNPTVAICSYNVLKYMLENKQLKDAFAVPDRNNLTLLSMRPTVERPELLRLGRIDMLGLEIYAYDATYQDESGETQSFIPEDRFIIGTPGLGKRLFGAVTQIETDGQYHTYEGQYIPKYVADPVSDVTTLAVSSRCVVVPTFIDSWGVIECK